MRIIRIVCRKSIYPKNNYVKQILKSCLKSVNSCFLSHGAVLKNFSGNGCFFLFVVVKYKTENQRGCVADMRNRADIILVKIDGGVKGAFYLFLKTIVFGPKYFGLLF